MRDFSPRPALLSLISIIGHCQKTACIRFTAQSRKSTKTYTRVILVHAPGLETARKTLPLPRRCSRGSAKGPTHLARSLLWECATRFRGRFRRRADRGEARRWAPLGPGKQEKHRGELPDLRSDSDGAYPRTPRSPQHRAPVCVVSRLDSRDPCGRGPVDGRGKPRPLLGLRRETQPQRNTLLVVNLGERVALLGTQPRKLRVGRCAATGIEILYFFATRARSTRAQKLFHDGVCFTN
jgi:hypothetical protein